MNDSAPKQEPPYGLRMPPDLKARVKAAAEENLRSMNAEIVARLEASFLPARGTSYASPDAAAILEGIFEYLAAEGWTPPSREVTDKKTQRIIKEQRKLKDERDQK